MLNEGLGSWPARRARMTPHRIAIKHDGATISYGQLADRVNRAAHALRDLGVRPGTGWPTWVRTTRRSWRPCSPPARSARSSSR